MDQIEMFMKSILQSVISNNCLKPLTIMPLLCWFCQRISFLQPIVFQFVLDLWP